LDGLLTLDGVSKSFGGVVALHGFSLSLSEGEHVGLLGPNGAGKTTLFNLIAGSLRADSGSITFRGVAIDSLGPHRRTSMGISRSFQIPRPFTNMTVLENVVAGAIFGGGASGTEARQKAEALLKSVSLHAKAHLPAGSLTLAEQRRLEFARALATSPRLLLLDEVMAGLSPVERASMADLLNRISKDEGFATIVSEHVIDSLVRLCDRLVVMDRGAKRGEGEAHAILESDLVAELYLGRSPRAVKS
jgi:branched-chain amino acid transport system ATP-binding protein